MMPPSHVERSRPWRMLPHVWALGAFLILTLLCVAARPVAAAVASAATQSSASQLPSTGAIAVGAVQGGARSGSPSAARPYGLVVHGGAGVIDRAELSPEREAQYRAGLAAARDAGYAVLERGGSALDAVVAAVRTLEDNPLFNAGKGAVFNADGLCELDASIMDGRTQAAGAVAGVRRIRNPIELARAVMEKSAHVMLTGEGAEKFAQQQGFSFVDNSYFHTEHRRQQLERARRREEAKSKTTLLPRTAPSTLMASTDTTVQHLPGVDGAFSGDAGFSAYDASSTGGASAEAFDRNLRYGTVGCVALDRSGNLAAGTSTGGMTNKKFGRVGDAPIIGAGTYAANATCAVSATGWGEYFIRVGVARDIAAQVEYRGTPLAAAAAATLDKVAALGGDGGVIAIDAHGRIALPFNTRGMYRGYRLSNGEAAIEIFGAGDAKAPRANAPRAKASSPKTPEH